MLRSLLPWLSPWFCCLSAVSWKSREGTMVQTGFHLVDKVVVATVCLVWRNERMWHRRESGRSLILSTSSHFSTSEFDSVAISSQDLQHSYTIVTYFISQYKNGVCKLEIIIKKMIEITDLKRWRYWDKPCWKRTKLAVPVWGFGVRGEVKCVGMESRREKW